MRRREFIAAIGSAAVAWPVLAAAQTRGAPVVSVLWHGTKEKEMSNPFLGWVVEGFEKTGLNPKKDVTLDHYFADESDARYAELAPEMVSRNPNVLLAIAVSPALALKKVHGNIPLVFAGSFDPVSLGLVDSLSKRHEPITGITGGYDLSGKRLAILRDAVPSATRVALIVNPKTRANTQNDIERYYAAANSLSVQVSAFDLAEFDQVEPTFDKIVKWGADAVVLAQSPLFALIREELSQAALTVKLPLMTWSDTFTVAGSLASYGPSLHEIFLATGPIVKRILLGEKAGEIPVLQPTKFDMVLNIKTAKALGLTFPPQFLATVDRVIE